MNRTRSAVLVATLVVLLGSAGCSEDDPQPKIAPSSQSPSPTADSSEPSSSPSPSASATPSASAESLGPVETVEAWVAAHNDAMLTGDTAPVRALGAADCEACEGLLDPIDDVHAAGGYFRTTGWKVDKAKSSRVGEAEALVNAAVTLAGGETLNGAGQEPVVYGVERSIIRFKLVRDDDQWLVSFIGFLS